MTGIGLREASKKYGIPKSTLSRRAAAGLIRKVREADSRGTPVLLYEPDVAAMAATWTPRAGQGRRLSLDIAVA